MKKVKLSPLQEKLLLTAILFGVGSFAILFLSAFKKATAPALVASGAGATATTPTTATSPNVTAPTASSNPYAGWQIDPQTGYSISPNTGNLVDPSTGNVYDPTSGAYLGNVNTNAPIDNTGLNYNGYPDDGSGDNYGGGGGGGGGSYPGSQTSTSGYPGINPVVTGGVIQGGVIQPYYNQLGQYVDTYHNNPNNPNYNLGQQQLVVPGRVVTAVTPTGTASTYGTGDVVASTIGGQSTGQTTAGAGTQGFLTNNILAGLGIGGSSSGSTGPSTGGTTQNGTQAPPTSGTGTTTPSTNAPTMQPKTGSRPFGLKTGSIHLGPSNTGGASVTHTGTGIRHDCGCGK